MKTPNAITSMTHMNQGAVEPVSLVSVDEAAVEFEAVELEFVEEELVVASRARMERKECESVRRERMSGISIIIQEPNITKLIR